jgi:tetratricopeptide (TPR) repeat protein
VKEFERQISDIAGCLRRAKDRDAKCSVLVGAGCSKSAGIPLASEMIDIIKKKCADAYGRAERRATNKVPTYSECMNQLSNAEVHHLIRTYVDDARLNWAHLGLAQLVEAGFVDRVLTTNFDPLVVRACNLVGVSPSVYDFAASADFQEDMVDGPAVYYLHGQRTGFRLLNVSDDLEKHTATLDPIINDSCRNRVWIVVGYSGENDAVFQCLSKIRNFRHNLYWVIRDDEPKAHLHSLFQSKRGAYYVKLPDADEFFCQLANELGCFPPIFVTQPFTHFLKLMEPVMNFTLPGSKTPNQSLLEYPRGLLQKAIDTIENNTDTPSSPDTATEVPTKGTGKAEVDTKSLPRHIEAREALWKGDYERALQLTDPATAGHDPQLAELRAAALFGIGIELHERGLQTLGPEAFNIFEQTIEKYQSALSINPDMDDALNNWGSVLSEQAKRKQGAEADELWDQAIQKYQQALNIKPDDTQVLSNYGAVLIEQAKRKKGDERDSLLAIATEKSLRAEEIQAGEGTFNLACIAELRGNQDEARRWLERCVEFDKLPPRRHIEEYEDLESLRGLPWFEEILQKAPQ